MQRPAAFLLVAVLALAACGRDAAGPSEPPRATPQPATLRMAGGTPLLELVPDAAVTDPVERQRLADLRAVPWIVAVHVARLVVDPDTVLLAGRAVAFDVNPTARLVFVGDRRTPNPATSSVSWHGALAEGAGAVGAGDAHVVRTALGVTASLHVVGPSSVSAGVQPLGPSGLHAVVQVDPGRLPPD